MARKKGSKGKKRAGRPDYSATAGYSNPSTILTDLIVSDQDPERVEVKAMPRPRLFGRPLKFQNPEDLQRRIDEYFAWCDPHIEIIEVPVFLQNRKLWVVDRQGKLTNQIPYTISGLAVFLETTRETLLDYEHLADKSQEDLPEHLRGGKNHVFLRAFSDTIKRAKGKIHGYVEQRLLMGGHPAGPIFNLKNNFPRWEDKTVVDNPAEAKYHKDIEELRKVVTGGYKGLKKKRGT